MSNFACWMMGAAAALGAVVPAGAAVLGPHAADCARGGSRPAMLVRVDGLKTRTGMLRVQSYGDPATFFDKGAYLERVQVAVPRSGPVEVCMALPRAGTYAVSVRHDADSNGKPDRGRDGGGFSGNPNVSLLDVVFKRKPSPSQVQVRVSGVTVVPVTLNYLQGASVGPIGG
ncbi:DUF2141 domain-containing protein [uncultured Sphingomonas sp.]|uniref:DUF2141 domain-containing protein n=1 Tax=uncultured Sphingomonas sp. TaxID=158754 RepID=UPI0025E4950F|nr:DUF2141 domain-containing protein [uncultured Sphingomonas sp.]